MAQNPLLGECLLAVKYIAYRMVCSAQRSLILCVSGMGCFVGWRQLWMLSGLLAYTMSIFLVLCALTPIVILSLPRPLLAKRKPNFLDFEKEYSLRGDLVLDQRSQRDSGLAECKIVWYGRTRGDGRGNNVRSASRSSASVLALSGM